MDSLLDDGSIIGFATELEPCSFTMPQYLRLPRCSKVEALIASYPRYHASHVPIVVESSNAQRLGDSVVVGCKFAAC